MAVAVGGSLCMSGVALGSALSMLVFGKKDQKPEMKDILNHILDSRRASAESDFDFEPPNPPSGWLASKAAARARAEQRKPELDTAKMNLAGGWEGFSMEDARIRNKQMQLDFKEMEPSEVLAKLQRGNARFWTGSAARPETSAFERRALIMQQFPQVAVLGCSDSRVPVEVIFDQGLGDMFVVRVAGNNLSTGTTASLQYAVFHLGVKVLMVMGHEGCGAIKAAGLPIEKINAEPEELASALKMLKRGLDEERLKNVHDARAHDREAVVTNVRRQVEGLCQDAAIMQKVQDKELIVVGCFYEISSGIVDFFMEVTEAPEQSEPKVIMKGVSEGVQSRLEYRKDRRCQTLPTPARGKSGLLLPSPDLAPVRQEELSS